MENAVFHHAYQNNHCIDWNDSKIMHKCNNYVKRKIIESVCIDHRQNFNLSEGTYKLDPLMRYMVNKSLSDPDNLLPDLVLGRGLPNSSQVSVGQFSCLFPKLACPILLSVVCDSI